MTFCSFLISPAALWPQGQKKNHLPPPPHSAHPRAFDLQRSVERSKINKVEEPGKEKHLLGGGGDSTATQHVWSIFGLLCYEAAVGNFPFCVIWTWHPVFTVCWTVYGSRDLTGCLWEQMRLPYWLQRISGWEGKEALALLWLKHLKPEFDVVPDLLLVTADGKGHNVLANFITVYKLCFQLSLQMILRRWAVSVQPQQLSSVPDHRLQTPVNLCPICCSWCVLFVAPDVSCGSPKVLRMTENYLNQLSEQDCKCFNRIRSRPLLSPSFPSEHLLAVICCSHAERRDLIRSSALHAVGIFSVFPFLTPQQQRDRNITGVCTAVWTQVQRRQTHNSH